MHRNAPDRENHNARQFYREARHHGKPQKVYLSKPRVAGSPFKWRDISPFLQLSRRYLNRGNRCPSPLPGGRLHPVDRRPGAQRSSAAQRALSSRSAYHAPVRRGSALPRTAVCHRRRRYGPLQDYTKFRRPRTTVKQVKAILAEVVKLVNGAGHAPAAKATLDRAEKMLAA